MAMTQYCAGKVTARLAESYYYRPAPAQTLLSRMGTIPRLYITVNVKVNVDLYSASS